jgi:transposase
LTVNLRSEDGSVILQRQVSTQWEKVRAFFADLAEKARPEGGFLAILEVCGMNPWLLAMLKEYGCREIVVIQPTERSKQKTDRRDAGELAHLLWVHRQHFLEGKHPLGVRRVQPPTPTEADDRQLTALRARLTKKRTAVLNGIHKILGKHNLEQTRPTKLFQTKKVHHWLAEIELPALDRLEMNLLIPQWEQKHNYSQATKSAETALDNTGSFRIY